MKAREFISKPASLNQSVDGGSLEGYVVDSDQPQLTNYLSGQGANPDVISAIKNKYKRIGIIRNMYVDEDNRGQGTGNNLVSNAIDTAAELGAQAIILVSDIHETNVMDLTKWYKGFGFEQVGTASGDPVMILEL
jgi:predicted GNAT family N-acyltransferase